MRLLGNLSKGIFFVVSAPAGTGKNTLVNLLKEEFPCVIESISYTTRKPRKGEVHGREYFFVSEEEFLRKVKLGEFLEHAKVFGSYYGTPNKEIFEQRETGHHVVLVIDTQGALSIKGKVPAVFIFIKPPSVEAIHIRLQTRNTETKESMEERLSWMNKEIEASVHYDYQIINEDLIIAYQVLRSIVIAEEHKVVK
ncbi:MAG: guanylate kinase [Chlamydiota bacterium]